MLRPLRNVCLTVLAAMTAGGALAGLASGANPTKSEETSAGPLSVSSIKSVFVTKELATRYSVEVTDLSKGVHTYASWRLSLELVDPAGSSPPGNTASHAALDETCDNSKLPGGSKESAGPGGPSSTVITWQRIGEDFTWYHGDKGSYLPSLYGCDHTKMGPSGHQGIVLFSVSSSDGDWMCTASIKGSNLSPVPEYSAAPTCTNELRSALEAIVVSVEGLLAKERTIADEIEAGKPHAGDDLESIGHSLANDGAGAHAHGADADTVDDLTSAAQLDLDASKYDLGTVKGRQRAVDDLTGAIGLKKHALAAMKRLVAAQPTR
jgi:hypothetical protein